MTPPTAADVADTPEKVRRGPRGGWMWTCEYCKRPASMMSTKGVRVCSQHGGATKAQTDPEVHAEARARGEEPPRPPGRPQKHGFYTLKPNVKVDELVAEYRARQLDPDATDDDMLFLRAYIDANRELVPDSVTVLDDLLAIGRELQEFRRAPVAVDTGTVSVERALRMLGRYEDLAYVLATHGESVKTFVAITSGIEERHANLVRLAKVRAETRFKDASAQQLDAFTLMVDRLMLILAEMLPRDSMEALQERMKRDLKEASVRLEPPPPGMSA